MNSTDMKKWLSTFVSLVAGTMFGIFLTSRAQAGVADSGPIRTPKAINTTGRITGIVVNPSPATAGSPVVVTIYGSGICPGMNLFVGTPDVPSIVTGPNVPTSVASANLDVDFRSSGSVQSQLIVRSPTAPGKPHVVKAASRQCDGLAETKLEVRPSAAAQIPGPAVAKAEQKVSRNIGALPAKEEKPKPPATQTGVAATGPVGAPNALRQPQPLQTRPLTGGPSGNPTLGGIDRVLVTPLPATVGNQVKFTIQGWGKCSSVGVSFGDSQQVYVLSDVDFIKPFETSYIYRTVTQPGQPYIMRVAGRAIQPSPCTGQATAQVDVRPVPASAKMPGSSVAKAQESIGGNIGGLPGALKDSMVEARGAQRQGAIPKSPPPPPEVTSVWTAGIKPGAPVAIVGKYFGNERGRIRLILDSNELHDIYLENENILRWKDDFVEAKVPANYPSRDTDRRILQVISSRKQASNGWSVHSGISIEEISMEVPAGVVKVERCSTNANRRNNCYNYGPSLSGFHSSDFGGSHQGQDYYSVKLRNGWRLHSYRFGKRDGIDGGLHGFEPGATEGYFFVRWFHDVVIDLSMVEYNVTLVIIGPSDLPPW